MRERTGLRQALNDAKGSLTFIKDHLIQKERQALEGISKIQPTEVSYE